MISYSRRMKNISEEKMGRAPGRPRDEDARERIREATASLLMEVGFANLTVDAIAQRSGTSKATIYRWWSNKVAVVIDTFVETLSPQLPLNQTETLEEYVDLHLKQFAKGVCGRNGRLLGAVIAAAQHDPEVEAAFLAHWIKPRRDLSKKALQKFKDAGQLPQEYDIDQVLDVMYGPLHFLLMVRHAKLTQAYADSLAAIVVKGILPRR